MNPTPGFKLTSAYSTTWHVYYDWISFYMSHLLANKHGYNWLVPPFVPSV